MNFSTKMHFVGDIFYFRKWNFSDKKLDSTRVSSRECDEVRGWILLSIAHVGSLISKFSDSSIKKEVVPVTQFEVNMTLRLLDYSNGKIIQKRQELAMDELSSVLEVQFLYTLIVVYHF
jgi:hypothetical protein